MDSKALEDLFTWVEEREEIRRKREEGLPPPWTKNRILANYRFCNVRRADDRVSRWIHSNIILKYPDSLLLASLGRWVNRPETLEILLQWDWTPPVPFDIYAHRAMELPRPFFNPAYVIPNCGLKMDKIELVMTIALPPVEELKFDSRKSLKETTLKLRQLFGWGNFMAYQTALDHCHDASDAYDWAIAGPGTRKGLAQIYGRNIGEDEQLEKIHEIRRLIHSNTCLPYKLRASDVANCLCELVKYRRGYSKVHFHPYSGTS